MEDVRALAGAPVKALPPPAAMLPPIDRPAGVAALISCPMPGLPAEGTVALISAIKAYSPKLSLDFVSQPSLAIAADRFGTYVGGGITLYWSDMLGDHNLVTMAQVNGRISDFAAAVGYINRRRRLSWSVDAEQIPYIIGGVAFHFGFTTTPPPHGQSERSKKKNHDPTGFVSGPFNRT